MPGPPKKQELGLFPGEREREGETRHGTVRSILYPQAIMLSE
jgi:hypothetical protein